jgi:hypothetical protein
MNAIDMHNHFIAPEVIDFLAREGEHYATRIVERDGRRFFLIQENALRPLDGPISDAAARTVSRRSLVSPRLYTCRTEAVESECILECAKVWNAKTRLGWLGDRSLWKSGCSPFSFSR